MSVDSKDETPSETPFDVGSEIDTIQVNIDYQIIEHFSEHLYGSPNKAVEELVSNAFDALAEEVRVYVPGRAAPDNVLVWDDGTAMDEGGLHALWWVARSPKVLTGRVAVAGSRSRKQIGKFGIGKLASYSVGRRITHICRKDDRQLLVSVDYSELHPEGEAEDASGTTAYSTPLRELTWDQTVQLVGGLFGADADKAMIDRFLTKKSWTLVAISDLKQALTPGRLSWVLGTGMPLRPDFKVYVNDDAVVAKLEKKAAITWDFSEPKLQQSIRSNWQEAVKSGTVVPDAASGTDATEPVFGAAVGLDLARPDAEIPYVRLPHLGIVWGEVRMFDESLLLRRSKDQGRSHGFFVMVRGRLLNPDDEKVFLHDPSFGVFYRLQFVLNVDDLDEDLLADRERLRRGTEKADALKVLQAAVYTAARHALEAHDQEFVKKEQDVRLLPTFSRELYREPIYALLSREDEDVDANFDVAKPSISRESIGVEKPPAVFSASANGFQVNTSHPYYVALDKKLGNGVKAREMFRTYEMFSISDTLLEGYLIQIGVPPEKVVQAMRWKDAFFRELADRYLRAPVQLATALRDASYAGEAPFEDAIAALLTDMGFRCERDGARGKKDVKLVATVGPDAYTMTIEAKGSIRPVVNDAAEVSAAAAHRNDVPDARHAVIIAREFAGFARPGDDGVAVLKECIATGGVSLMTVEALIELHGAVRAYAYPLSDLVDIFTIVESPAEKLARIRALSQPTEGFDYRELLEELWRRQGEESSGDVVPFRHVYQSWFKPREKAKGKKDDAVLTFDEFRNKLVALETLSDYRVRLQENHEVFLTQSPEIIIDHIERRLAIGEPAP